MIAYTKFLLFHKPKSVIWCIRTYFISLVPLFSDLFIHIESIEESPDIFIKWNFTNSIRYFSTCVDRFESIEFNLYLIIGNRTSDFYSPWSLSSIDGQWFLVSILVQSHSQVSRASRKRMLYKIRSVEIASPVRAVNRRSHIIYFYASSSHIYLSFQFPFCTHHYSELRFLLLGIQNTS